MSFFRFDVVLSADADLLAVLRALVAPPSDDKAALTQLTSVVTAKTAALNEALKAFPPTPSPAP